MTTTTERRVQRARRWLRQAAEDVLEGAALAGEALAGPRLRPVPVPVPARARAR